MKITTTKSFDITYDHFEAVIVTALEGGSNYWYNLNTKEFKDKLPKAAGSFNCLTEKISKALYEDTRSRFKMNVYDVESDELLGTVTHQSMIKAFKLAAIDHYHNFENIISGNYDAADADVIFQLAVMGNVVFG